MVFSWSWDPSLSQHLCIYLFLRLIPDTDLWRSLSIPGFHPNLKSSEGVPGMFKFSNLVGKFRREGILVSHDWTAEITHSQFQQQKFKIQVLWGPCSPQRLSGGAFLTSPAPLAPHILQFVAQNYCLLKSSPCRLCSWISHFPARRMFDLEPSR